MKMKKSMRSGYEFTMSRKCALILIQELAKAVNHCEDNEYSGMFYMRCDLLEKGKENNVINIYKVLPDKENKK